MAGVVLGCSATPTAAPSAASPTATYGTAAPIVSPSPEIASATPSPTLAATLEPPQLGGDWEQLALPGEQTVVSDGVYGEPGFVLVGSTCPGGGRCSQTATAWFQADGRTWEQASIANAQLAVITDVAYNGAYFAAGTRLKRGVGKVIQPSGVVWRSDNGRDWTMVGSVAFQECDADNGSPGLSEFEVTQGGLMIATWGGGAGTPDLGTYRSSDGRRWDQVDPALVGHRPENSEVVGSIVFDDSIVLAWSAGSSIDLWSTETGRAWNRLGRVKTNGVSLTSDGQQIVVAGSACPDACETRLWSWRAGAGLKPLGNPIAGVIDAHVAFAGIAGFVLAGVDGDALTVFGSPDGVTWVKRARQLDLGACFPRALVSGPATVLLVSEDCDHVWLSR
jgi:hypothetical protein